MPLKDPEERRRYNAEYRRKNIERLKEYGRQRYQENREQMKAASSANYYANREAKLAYEGEQWERKRGARETKRELVVKAFLESQNGMCAVCETTSPGPRGWFIDHDHSCCPIATPVYRRCGKCNRGALCHGCNAGIGLLQESPKNLRAAAKYIERWDK